MPGASPKTRKAALRQASSGEAPLAFRASLSSRMCFRTKLSSSDSSNFAAISTALSMSSARWGRVSRNRPLMRTVTSMRGRFSSFRGMTSSPVTRRLPFCHTGLMPSRYRNSAMSWPLLRILGPDHMTMPIFSGYFPSSLMYFSIMRSPSFIPAIQPAWEGSARGSTP